MNPERPNSSIARFPGQEQDPSARIKRGEFLVSEPNLDAILEQRPQREKGATDHELKIDAYAAGSIAIESLWDHMKQLERNGPNGFRELLAARLPEDATVAQFVAAFNQTLNAINSDYIDDLLARMRANETRPDDAFMLRFMLVEGELERGKGVPVPSMADLVTFYGRMYELAPRVFERDRGRQPTQAEVAAILDNPSMVRFFTGMMTNAREIIGPITAQFEKSTGTMASLDDPEATFDPDKFVLQGEGSGTRLVPHPELIAKYRKAIEGVAERWRAEGKTPRALQCPALYTGKFAEMYTWVSKEFKEYFADQSA